MKKSNINNSSNKSSPRSCESSRSCASCASPRSCTSCASPRSCTSCSSLNISRELGNRVNESSFANSSLISSKELTNITSITSLIEEYTKDKSKKSSIKREKIGLIKGHGIIIPNRICLVPSNLQLYIPVDNGNDLIYGNENSKWYTSCIRRPSNRQEYINKLNRKTKKRIIINGDTPVLDILITFDPTFTGKGKPHGLFNAYSSVGIITDELKPLTKWTYLPHIEGNEDDEFSATLGLNIPKQNELLSHLEQFTTCSHNNRIIPTSELYRKSLRLSEILNKISLYKRDNPRLNIPSKFMLMVCRSNPEFKLNNIDYTPISTLHTTNYTNISYSHLYQNFTFNLFDKLKKDINIKKNKKLYKCIYMSLIYLIKNKRIYGINFDLLFLYLINGNVEIFYKEYNKVIEKINIEKDELEQIVKDIKDGKYF